MSQRLIREVWVAHVELSLSGAYVPQARTPAEVEFVGGIARWTSTVASAPEPCLVIDVDGMILAVSALCSDLLGLGASGNAVGQPLLGGVLRLIDFTAGRIELAEPETQQIPPLLALSSQRLARGLMRVQPGECAADLTVDAISTPLWEGGRVAASLTFFSPVR
jgi:PAS domain-containing protein